MKNIMWDVSTKQVCTSGQSMFFTDYWRKPFQPVSVHEPEERKNLPKLKYCSPSYCSETRILTVLASFCPALKDRTNPLELFVGKPQFFNQKKQ